MNVIRRSTICAAASVLLLLAACGGGGGGGGDEASPQSPPSSTASGSLSGTAAAGAPIIGTVTVKDSATPPQTKVGAIDANGKYNIDVTGMTAPFMLRAEGTVGGRSYSLHSAAAISDVNATVNITPLTDLIVANIAGQLAEAAYNSGNFSGMTPAALDAAQSALRARLQPVLSAVGLSDSIDLLRASFNTDKTGLDAALDVIRVTVDPAALTATITNVVDNQQIIDQLASQTDATVLTQTNVAAGVSDLQQITALFDQLTALFATSLPASDNATLRGLFDPAFLHDGENLDAFLGELTTDPALIGIKFTNIALDSLAASTADVAFAVQFSGPTFYLTMQVNKIGGAWKISGNRRIARVEAYAFARHHVNSFRPPPEFDTGLNFEIQDPAGIADYAIVTGPGLPSGGALYVRLTSQGSFKAAQGTYNGIDNATPSLNQYGHNQYPLSDDAITGIPDNAVYTVQLRDDAGTPTVPGDDTTLASYTTTVAKRPFLNTELGASLFAAISAPTPAQILSVATSGGTLSASWTLPAGTSAWDLHFFRSGASFFHTANADLAASATSASITVEAAPAPVQGSGINLNVADEFGRERTTILQGQ